MNGIKSLLWCLSTTVLLSCQETLEEPNESYIKVLGKELSSYGSKIKQLSTKEFVVLGQTEVISFDSVANDYVSIASPSIYVVNESGNVVKEKIFSRHELTASGGVARTLYLDFENDITNSGFITDIVAIAGDQYLAMGHWENTEVAQRILDPLTAIVDFPFYLVLDGDFNIKNLSYINGEAGWDFNLKYDHELVLGPDNSLYIFYKSMLAIDFSWTAPILNSLQRLDSPFEWESDIPTNPGISNKGVALNFSANGNPLVLSQLNSDLIIEELNVADGSSMNEYFVYNFGNANEVFGQMVQLREGYVVVAQASGESMKVFQVDETLMSVNGSTISESTDQELIDATSTDDDHLLVLTRGVNAENGIIRKVSPSGTVLWQFALEGIPTDIMEIDGHPFCLYNPVFNGLLKKATLIKLNQGGTL